MSREFQSPSNNFESQHPEHAEMIRRTVDIWYESVVRQFIFHHPDLLRQTMGQFLKNSVQQPDSVVLRSGTSFVPLNFASQNKREELLQAFRRIPPPVFVQTFEEWFNQNLGDDANPQAQDDIKKIASLHLFDWVGRLPSNLQEDKTIWNDVTSYLQGNNLSLTRDRRELEAVSVALFGSIQAAVVELFISDNYAPRDLFGNTTIQ